MTNKEFVEERLTIMANRPLMYAGTTESFILLLILLVEISWLNYEVNDSSGISFHGKLMRELCGKESGCAVPLKEITDEWAKSRVEIARRYLPK